MPAERRQQLAQTAKMASSEKALVAILAANLIFLTWAFGGVDGWSQIASAVLSVVALVLACVPRKGDRVFTPLWRLPAFWLGTAILAYGTLQALNPAYEYLDEGTVWWLVNRSHIAWLPAGMRVPFAQMSPERFLMVAATLGAMACAAWAGITRKRSLMWLLSALCVNAFVLASFGLLQRAAGATQIYGVHETWSPYFFAAFIYKNHAAAFFVLMFAVTSGLGLRAASMNRRRGVNTEPAVVFGFFAAVFLIAIVTTHSVMGCALAALIAAAVAAKTGWPRARHRLRLGRAALLLVGGAVAVLVFSGGSFAAREVEKKSPEWSAEFRQGMHTRQMAAAAGWKMFNDRPLLGWGAGCFQYGFTKYQRENHELVRWRHLTLRWEHVHNDWLEFLIEFGVVGAGLLVALLACAVRAASRFWRQDALFPMLTGVLAVLLHAFVDFPFRNPAVVMTTGVLFVVLIRWADLVGANDTKAG